MRAWYRRGDNAARQRESAKRSRERRLEAVRAYDRARGFRIYDELKVEARKLVKLAVESGRLTKTPCEVCGEPKSDGHHPDYAKPLEVQWLCRAHHAELHRQVA